MKKYFPVMLDLTDQTVLVVGGGKVATHKVAQLLDCEASVCVVAPTSSDVLQKLAEEGKIVLIEREFEDADLKDAKIVIVAIDDECKSESIATTCKAAGSLVNVVDRPSMCDFIFSSFMRSGPLTLAVSTSGASPAWARKIRIQLEAEYNERYATMLKAIGEVRRRLINEIDDLDLRATKIKQLGSDELLERATKVTADELKAELEIELGLEQK